MNSKYKADEIDDEIDDVLRSLSDVEKEKYDSRSLAWHQRSPTAGPVRACCPSTLKGQGTEAGRGSTCTGLP